MYVDRGIVYADPGYYVHAKNKIGFQLRNQDDIEESKLVLEDIKVNSGYVYFNREIFSIKLRPAWRYEDYKTHIIKMRYSNDDQLAIILNREMSEEDQIRYNRMQSWRDFSAKLAKLITNII